MRRKISKHFSGNTERLVNKIFFVVIPVLLGLSLVFSVYNSSRANQTAQELRRQNDQLVALSDQQKNSLNTTRSDVADLKETLLCIGVFFSSPDRANLVISSYVPCVVQNTKTGDTRQLNLTGEGSPNTPSGSGGSRQSGSVVDNSQRSSSSNSTPSQQQPQPDNSQGGDNSDQGGLLNGVRGLVNGTIDVVEGLF